MLDGAANVNADEAFAARGRDLLARMEEWNKKREPRKDVGSSFEKEIKHGDAREDVEGVKKWPGVIPE